MELSVNPGPKPIGHVIQASIALQRYKIIRNFQIKMQKIKEDIINLSNAGLAVEEIAEELECDEGCVFAVLEEAGIL